MVTTGGEKGVVSRLGFEPRTPALKGQCSTIELPAHIRKDVADSNKVNCTIREAIRGNPFGQCQEPCKLLPLAPSPV